MKRIIMLLCAASVIVMSACHCSSHKPHNDSLAGIWVSNSLQVNGSLKNKSWPMISSAIKDSGTLSYQFNKDSSFEAVMGKDSVRGKFTISNDTLNLSADSSLESFTYSLAGDSLLQLTSVDSARLVLYRKL